MSDNDDKNDNGPWGKNDQNNVVELNKMRQQILDKCKKRQAADKESEKKRNQNRQNPSYYMPNSHSNSPPMFNIPNGTKYLLMALIGIHFIITFLINDENSWLHIAMNGVMLLAFGSGLEKWIGTKKMIQIFFICGIFGVVAHFIFNLNSLDPVIGASGGLSGMFAAALIMLHRQNQGLGGKYGMMPIIVLWLGISILFGIMGSPDGNSIAWIAHIGGFLGGFAAVKILKI